MVKQNMMSTTAYLKSLIQRVFKDSRDVLLGYSSRKEFMKYISEFYDRIIAQYDGDGRILASCTGRELSNDEVIARVKISLIHEFFKGNSLQVPRSVIFLMIQQCMDWQDKHYVLKILDKYVCKCMECGCFFHSKTISFLCSKCMEVDGLKEVPK